MAQLTPLADLATGYGARLRAVRKALGRSAKDLAAELNASPQRWSHWEVERHPPDFFVMLALKQRYNISLDWIYAGDWRGLPGTILQHLLNQASQPDADRPLQLFRAQFLAGTGGTGSLAVHDDQRPLKAG